MFRPFAPALILALAGCTSLSLGSRTRLESSSVEPAHLRSVASLEWRVPLATLTDLEARSRCRAKPAYDATRGVLYVGGLDRGVHAIRARDGAVLWRFQTLAPVEGTPTVDGDTVYIGSTDGALYALNARSGEMRWRFATVAEIIHAPVVTRDSVYFVNADDTVFAADKATGTSRWRYRREPPGGITGGGHAGLLYDGRRLYTGFSDGRAVALDPADGTPIWERDTSVDSEAADGANEAHRTIDVDTTPVLVEGNLFVASYTAGLYALDPAGGGVRWRVDRLLNISSLSDDGRNVYATSASLGLVKVSATDGEVVWMRDLGSRAIQQTVVRGGVLYAPSADNTLWLVRASDGEPIAGLGPEGVSGSPEITANHLFFETNRGVVYAWRFLSTDPT